MGSFTRRATPGVKPTDVRDSVLTRFNVRTRARDSKLTLFSVRTHYVLPLFGLSFFLLAASLAASLRSLPILAAPPPPPPRILYVVLTCPKYYHTKLHDVLSTYLAAVPAGLVLPVGNVRESVVAPNRAPGAAPGAVRNVTVLPTGADDAAHPEPCMENHEIGVTCKEGRAVWHAFERRDMFDWFMVVDDDVYVHRHNLERAAEALDPEERVVHTVPGCGPKAKCASAAGGGICGGGGWLLSRQNLVRTVCAVMKSPSPMCKAGLPGSDGLAAASSGQAPSSAASSSAQTHLKLWMRNWMDVGAEVAREEGYMWADITAGCVLHKLGGVRTAMLNGLHPWTFSPKDLITRLTEHAPLSFHYVDRDEMPGIRALHALVNGTLRGTAAREERGVKATAAAAAA